MQKIMGYIDCESESDLTEVKGLLQSVSVAPTIMADLVKLPGGAGAAEKLQCGVEGLSRWAATNVCGDGAFLAVLGDIIGAVDAMMPLPEGAGSSELNKLFTSFDLPSLPESLGHNFLLRCDGAFLTNGLELQFVDVCGFYLHIHVGRTVLALVSPI